MSHDYGCSFYFLGFEGVKNINISELTKSSIGYISNGMI